ncbi:MAG: hypothetical protein WCB18_04695 [Thermoplasmata archaeon]
MTRSILSASLTRPSWQWGPFRVEGPDEDAFTLGVAALRRLEGQLRPDGERALRRLHIVGSFAPEADWAFGEALGIPKLEVRRHPPNSPGVWGALAAAAHDEGSRGREAVVVADVVELVDESTTGRGVKHAAGAAAFLLGKDPGLAVLPHGFRGHVPGRSPSLKGSVSGWLEALGLTPGHRKGEVVFEVEEDVGRWQAAWEEVAPGITVTLFEAPPRDLGPAPTLRAAWLLWELARRLRTGETGVVGEVARGRSGFAGFRLDGPVRWFGSWGTTTSGLAAPDLKFLERDEDLGTVSQGAYVPHPRYVENLASRWRLTGERCAHCHTLTFPVTGRCRSCRRTNALHPEALRRTGLKVEAVTTVSPGAQPTEFDAVVRAAGGYDVAIVALGSEVRATVQLTDTLPRRLKVGDPVGLALRRLYPMEGEWRYGLKGIPERSGPEETSEPPGATSRTPRRRASFGAPTGRRAMPRGSGGRAPSRRPRKR